MTSETIKLADPLAGYATGNGWLASRKKTQSVHCAPSVNAVKGRPYVPRRQKNLLLTRRIPGLDQVPRERQPVRSGR